MGSEIDADQLPTRPALHFDLATEAMLDRVDIYRNGWRVDTMVLSGRRQELTWTDPDHECAWTSPIWINRSPR